MTDRLRAIAWAAVVFGVPLWLIATIAGAARLGCGP
jgi:hypothetical protein